MALPTLCPQQDEALREDRKRREALREEERKRELDEERLQQRKEVRRVCVVSGESDAACGGTGGGGCVC